MGISTIAWRSSKQPAITVSTAESEVQAVANTGIVADYVKTLRESLCLPTKEVKLRCDNTVAIVLSTGEGPWKTKSAANKVVFTKEQVEHGLMKIEYVSTKLQAASSLTKAKQSFFVIYQTLLV